MTAEVVDKFSTPLKNLQNQLRGIGSGGTGQKLKQEFDNVGAAVTRVGREIRDVLTPALAGIGIAGLTVSGAILGVGTALRSFAGNTAQLSLLSREIGISAQKLREFGALGSHFGLDEGTMQGAARSFAQNLRDMRNGASEVMAWLRAQGKSGEQRGIFQQFGADLKASKSNAEALEKALEFLQRVPDGIERGMLAEKLFGNRALGLLGTEDIKKALEEIRKAYGEALGPKAEKDALAFERGIGLVQMQLKGLRDSIAADVMPEVNDLLGGVRKVFEENRGEIKDGIIGFLRDLRSYDWKGTFGGIKEALAGFNSGVQDVGGWKTIFVALLGLKAAGIGVELAKIAGAIFRTGRAADAVMTGGALARFVGLIATPLGAGTIGTALLAILGMKVLGDRRAKTIGSETEQELADAKSRKEEFEKNAAGRNDSVVQDRRKLFEDQIQKLEEKLTKLKEQGLDKQSVEEGTKKGILEGLTQWMLSKTLASGQYGGAQIQNASYGGSSRARNGETGSDVPPISRETIGNAGRAPGVRETQEALGAGGEGGVHKGGTRGAASRQFMMRAAMDQLRREGVPEGNLRAAAAHLVGQAEMESGLDPNKVHDGGTGYGIYGARDPGGRGKQRRTRMLQWLAANGYARNSAEGQMRYMAHEAMTDRDYARTRRTLMNANPSTFESDTNTITGNFEAPKVINRRSGAVAGAFRAGPAPQETAKSDGLRGQWPSLWKGKSAGDGEQPSWGGGLDAFRGAYERRGQLLDSARENGLMGGSTVEPKGSVNVRLEGFPKGVKASTSMDGLFKEVSLSRGASMPMSEDA
jgi:hypothetical protein